MPSLKRVLQIIGLSIALLPVASRACTVTATSFEFGAIDPLAAVDTTSTSTVTVTCSSSTSYTIALSAGSGTFAQREMLSGGSTLAYNLYSDPSDTQIWGDGTGGTVMVSGTADSSGTTSEIYGRVPAQSSAVPGTYSDSIVVTISY